jgi:hypothetical protein
MRDAWRLGLCSSGDRHRAGPRAAWTRASGRRTVRRHVDCRGRLPEPRRRRGVQLAFRPRSVRGLCERPLSLGDQLRDGAYNWTHPSRRRSALEHVRQNRPRTTRCRSRTSGNAVPIHCRGAFRRARRIRQAQRAAHLCVDVQQRLGAFGRPNGLSVALWQESKLGGYHVRQGEKPWFAVGFF